jgi:bifunctional non-homologous end joining protein LigD
MTKSVKKSNNDSKTEKEYSTNVPLPTAERFDKIKHYLTSKLWVAQQKFDGHRLLTVIRNGTIIGYSRNGAIRTVPNHFTENFDGFTNLWMFDGELIGDTYHIFDIPHAGTEQTSLNRYDDRIVLLQKLFNKWNPTPQIQLVETMRTPQQKSDLAQRLLREHAEGIVFKNIGSTYDSGRTLDWRKIKFTNTVDVIVLEPNHQGKHTALIGLKTGDLIIPVGKVSTHLRPPVDTGDIIEVRYLTVTPSGKLTQPVMIRKRDDKTIDECSIDQLKNLYP